MLAEPVTQTDINEALAEALLDEKRITYWQNSAKNYLQQNNLYQLAERASAIIMNEDARADS